MRREFDIDLNWRGFELHPETPRGGILLADYFPAERLPAMREHMLKVAEHFGVTGMRPVERLSNTRRALALAEVARDLGRLDPFRDAAMDAYWKEAKDLESDEVLLAVSRRAGLPDDSLSRADNDAVFLQRVADAREEAEQSGVRAIPTFVMAGYGVVGCQPYEVLEELAERAGAARRTKSEE